MNERKSHDLAIGRTFALASSSSREQLAAEVTDVAEHSYSGLAYLVEIVLTGDSWLAYPFDNKDYDLESDFRVRLSQVAISRPALESLCDRLRVWLKNPQEIDVSLAADHTQVFDVRFGPRDEYINEVGKPVCTITYSHGSMKNAEWSFVVDQSCIRLLKSDLVRLLDD